MSPKTKKQKTRELLLSKSALLWILNKHYITCRVVGITNQSHNYKIKIRDITREQLAEKLEGLKKWE